MPDSYDVIIVGAGMGGLICGNFLAAGGRRVLILEQNHQPGGLMGGFRRQGFYFDVGDQSIESMGITFPLLELLGLYDPDEWERAMYRIIVGSVDHTITDFEGTGDALAEVFPAGADGIRRSFVKLEEISGFLGALTEKGRFPYTAHGLEQVKGLAWMLAAALRKPSLTREAMSGKISELQARFVTDPEALRFVADLGYSGMSTLTGAGFWHMWIHDYWYPRDGIQSLMDKLAASFRGHGGELRLKTLVEEVVVSGGRAAGVRTAGGEVLEAGRVVYCADMTKLYTKMLPPGTASPSFLKKITAAPLAEPLVALYLGLDIPVEELRRILKVHHTFHIPRTGGKDINNLDDPDLHRDTWIEINAPCLDNPELAPAGKCAVTVQTMTSYNWMDNWGTHGDDSARTDEYKRLKEKVTDDLLHNLENVIPDVREKVACADLGTPLSTIRFTLNKEGGSCAFTFDPELAPFARQPLQFRTPVRGLYQAGQWSLWPGGIVGSMMSGRIVAAHILSGYYNDVTDRAYQFLRKTVLRG